MDKEALRKQLYEEIQSQFEAKLREAKRQKSQLEEELEVSSEKWRTERRRLNAEIDRLEAALGEARQSGRKANGVKPGKTADPQEIAKVQAAADEKISKAAVEWEGERSKMQSEIARLQSGIADLIEKSNNPLRTNQLERERLEAKCEEALRARRQAEGALLAAKAEWEEEKLRLVGEAVKFRRAPGATVAPSKAVDAQLERQTQEAARLREALANDLEKARIEISRLKETHSLELQDLNSRLEKSRAEAKTLAERLDDARNTAGREHAELERRLRESADARAKLERELEKAKQATGTPDAAQASEVARLQQELEYAKAELRRQAEETDHHSGGEAGPGAVAESEYNRLRVELEQMQEDNRRLEQQLAETGDAVSSDAVDDLRRQYEQRIDQLTEELERARTEVELSRHTSMSAANSNGNSGSGLDLGTIDAEVERVEEMISTIAELIDNPETELSTVIRKNVERAELDAYLKGILFSLGRGKGL
jgi:DNA repair exonuclease SbcCD ATPase subunit